jgi:hypothetical protein
MLKLSSLAAGVAAGEDGPRFIFLVGGPGNGKSEAVQSFVQALDHRLHCGGSIVAALRAQLERQPGQLVGWQATATGADAGHAADAFERTVGRLVVVQDASASEAPDGDAAMQLVEALTAILDSADKTLFLCCINRGVLARCRVLASRDPRFELVAELATRLGEATAIGGTVEESSCWPLSPAPPTLQDRVACWPMDTESLLLADDDEGLPATPVGVAFGVASRPEHWEVEGRCADCDSRELCPFRQNVQWIRDETVRVGLLRVLRRGELATGRRWNFRDTFSLVAELLVGERSDFLAHRHPCEWVHERVAAASGAVVAAGAVGPTHDLVGRLFPHALFRSPVTASPTILKGRPAQDAPTTAILQTKDVAARAPASTYVRRVLEAELSPRLDPALMSPHDADHPLGRIEDDYSASVTEGNLAWPPEFAPAAAETALLSLLAQAEEEWDPQSREAAVAARAIAYLRATGAVIAKRSVGVRSGSDAGGAGLDQYGALLRDPFALRRLKREITHTLLGNEAFEADPVEVYGQPRRDTLPLVYLRAPALPIERIVPAPERTPERPAHDIPFLVVAGHRVPLTFDLFLAVHSRQEHLSTGAISAAAQASLDRIRHLYAGQACRRVEWFQDGDAYYVVVGHGKVALGPAGDTYFESEA